MTMPASRDLGLLLREQADRFGAHPALIHDGETIGYDTLADRAARIASFLAARGVKRGDRVGLLMNNRPEWVETFFGAAMAGAVVVAFSTWSKRDELAYLIEDSGIRLLVTLDQFSGQNFAADIRAMAPVDVVVLGDDRDPGWTPYRAMLDAAAHGPTEHPGASRGRCDHHLHVRLLQPAKVRAAVAWRHHREWLQYRRTAGLHRARSGLAGTAAVLVLRQRQRPVGRPDTWRHAGAATSVRAGEALDLIERHRCTALYTLPAITAALIGHPLFRPERTRSLRTGLTIGAPQDVMTAAEVLGAHEICNVYGQTETYGNCCVTWHHWPLERRAACQGPPLPGVTIRIVDETTGAILPPGQAGLIEVKGYVMRGYIGASASQTEAALTEDGFFRTGDMGELTETGDIRFIGRTTEMIKKGGINVAPAEVEDVLMRHPSVALAGVVGVPDATQGELIAAFVVPMPGQTLTEAALTAHCREHASRYKVPDFIALRDSLPVTVTGKLLRRDLKTLAADFVK